MLPLRRQRDPKSRTLGKWLHTQLISCPKSEKIQKSAKTQQAAVTAGKARLGWNPLALWSSEVPANGLSESIWQSGQGELVWKRWVILKCNSGEPCCAPRESRSATPPDYHVVCLGVTEKNLTGRSSPKNQVTQENQVGSVKSYSVCNASLPLNFVSCPFFTTKTCGTNHIDTSSQKQQFFLLAVNQEVLIKTEQ